MHPLAFNYFNIDPNGNLQSSTLALGGGVFSDLAPVWNLILGVGIAVLFVSVIFFFIKHH